MSADSGYERLHGMIDSWRDDTTEERNWKNLQHRILKVKELRMPVSDAMKALESACPGYNITATTSCSGPFGTEPDASAWQFHAEPMEEGTDG